jgi:hypothetical protein
MRYVTLLFEQKSEVSLDDQVKILDGIDRRQR